jgi:hypothetical protein
MKSGYLKEKLTSRRLTTRVPLTTIADKVTTEVVDETVVEWEMSRSSESSR